MSTAPIQSSGLASRILRRPTMNVSDEQSDGRRRRNPRRWTATARAAAGRPSRACRDGAASGDARPDRRRPWCAAFGYADVISDNVAGMMNAAPAPATAAGDDDVHRVRPDRPAPPTPRANTTRPAQQRAAAAVAVADAPRGQQQAGQRQRVAVDDPGQLGLGGDVAFAMSASAVLSATIEAMTSSTPRHATNSVQTRARRRQVAPSPGRYPGRTVRACRPCARSFVGAVLLRLTVLNRD